MSIKTVKQGRVLVSPSKPTPIVTADLMRRISGTNKRRYAFQPVSYARSGNSFFRPERASWYNLRSNITRLTQVMRAMHA
jgi:hypothetical protein